MKITLAKPSGVCFGVKRAVELAENSAGDNVFVLVELIHNRQVVEALERKGVRKVDDVSQLRQGNTLVIRSHGAPKEVYDYCEKNGIKVMDATCPFVRKAQEHAKELYDGGYQVIIVGKKDHPEVVGIRSFAPNAVVIEDENEDFVNGTKIGVVCQTTFSKDKFDKIVSKLKDAKVFNTICNATSERQKAAKELAKESDIMIVIGGKNSSNTTKLKEICSEVVETYHIETSDYLKEEWFEGKEKVGITAGASTPDYLIVEVIRKINK